MIGLALALVVVGVVLLFIIPWVGIPVGIIGLLLAIGYVFGVGRRAAASRGALLPELRAGGGGAERVSSRPGACPRCGAPYAAGQEYCVECGLRLPAETGRFARFV